MALIERAPAVTAANTLRRVGVPASSVERAAVLDELSRRWRGSVVRVQLAIRGARFERVGLMDVYAAGDATLRSGDVLVLRSVGRSADYLSVPAEYVTEISVPKLEELRAILRAGEDKR